MSTRVLLLLDISHSYALLESSHVLNSGFALKSGYGHPPNSKTVDLSPG